EVVHLIRAHRARKEVQSYQTERTRSTSAVGSDVHALHESQIHFVRKLRGAILGTAGASPVDHGVSHVTVEIRDPREIGVNRIEDSRREVVEDLARESGIGEASRNRIGRGAGYRAVRVRETRRKEKAGGRGCAGAEEPSPRHRGAMPEMCVTDVTCVGVALQAWRTWQSIEP